MQSYQAALIEIIFIFCKDCVFFWEVFLQAAASAGDAMEGAGTWE